MGRDGARDDYEAQYMSTGEPVFFREKVVSRKQAAISMWMAVGFGIMGLTAALIAGFAGSGPAATLGMPFAGVGALMGFLGVLFAVTRLTVTSRALHVHFGWMRRRIPLDSIRSVTMVPTPALRHGKIRMRLDGVVETWVGAAASGRGLRIEYRDGKREHILTMGSADSEAFLRVLESARSRARIGAGPQLRVAPAADEVAEGNASEAEAQAVEEASEPEERRAPRRAPRTG